MEAPKRFAENTTAASAILKNGTEFMGMDQAGVAKSVPVEVLLTKANVGLGNVDNTSDANKPVSTAQQSALDLKKNAADFDQAVKTTSSPTFVQVTAASLVSAFQKLASHTIPDSTDDILRLQNQQSAKPHTIFEVRSPDAATVESTLSLHNVKDGTDDWVFDLSFHNYSGLMKLVSVISHFTGTDAGSWEWVSRYSDGTPYSMTERYLMKLDGASGYLLVGESGEPAARVHVKQSGYLDKPAIEALIDSSHENQPEAIYAHNTTNYAHLTNLVRLKLFNATDTATILKLEHAGTGNYIDADDKFVVNNDGEIKSPTVDEIKGTGWTATDNLVDHGVAIGVLQDKAVKHYGLNLNYTDGVTYTRTGDAVGKVYRRQVDTVSTPSDFSALYPWSHIRMLEINAAGNILAEHGDADFGTNSGDLVVRIPLFWSKVTRDEADNIRSFDVYDAPYGDVKATGFYDADGNIKPYFDIACVPTTMNALIPQSWAGAVLAVNKALSGSAGFQQQALDKGAGWSEIDAWRWQAVTTLLAVECGDLDMKDKVGVGINSAMPYGSGAEFKCTVSQTGANSIIIANAGATNMRVGMLMQVGTTYTAQDVASNRYITLIEDYDASNKRITVDGAVFNSVAGTTAIASWGQPVPLAQINALGTESGYVLQFDSVNRSHVCYRGIWDLWGNIWQWLAGLMRHDDGANTGTFYLANDQSLMNTTDPRSTWESTAVRPNLTDGYLKDMRPYDTEIGSLLLPHVTGGGAGSGTWFASYLYYFNLTYTGSRAVLFGGSWGFGSYCSLFCWLGSNSPSNTNVSFGGRLIRM